MRITPLEIRQKTFEKGFRGYEKEEVDAFLLTLSVEWEKNIEDIRTLKAKIELQDKELTKLREIENSLYKTLKTAETTGTTLVEQANKSAELIMKEAQMNADALLNDSRYSAKNLMEEAENRAKNIADEAKDHVKMAQRELKEIDNLKDNLLSDLKNLSNDVIDKINRMYSSSNKKSYENTQNSYPTQNQDANSEPKIIQKSFFDNL